ncbi:CitMHS family citrate-Mg2+:H+ or citrate-Ca2+:H+ symporter [Williamsia limnetica]|jgi:CitMHS family citrate-Mg2+:H+ or citrate-Ca2+:H+ symporter|uniref:CitMHS family citrate-Mg2+:H+ or citrate-Ca2+:H+ symporter n=1 Tax=Williamsia limnetica TaxID=882452 RepID=A0A318RRR6_WILLI|nr:SLC13 family permease [Williamsia limnetica]PYE19926.1 CitMHS family citrate-Mg2+:H+ or citrate-Ca2+:H+ symporter [Williamsia limnetica]
MLVALGLAMVATFMFLIITKRATPVVALILVPVAFGLFAGAGMGISDMITDGIKDLAPTAAMLFFAIIYFGIMIDVGLFDPIVRGVVKAVRADPARLVVGTALLAMIVSLDGDGSTTFIIVTSALLPLYLKLGVSPVVLTVTAGLANGTLNILPWGGPTARAAAALGISPSDVFIPMIPSLVAGLVIVLLFSYHLGVMERRRIGKITIRESVLSRENEAVLVGTGGGTGSNGTGGSGRSGGTTGGSTGENASGGGDSSDGGFVGNALDPHRTTLRPKLFWVNAGLTIALLAVLGMDVIAIPVLFMVAAALALVINFPHVKDQQSAITRHSSSIVSVVAMVLAAAVLTGVFAGSGMVEAIAEWLTSILPDAMGPHLAVVAGVLSIPFTFLMSNDAFYFGILPVLSETAATYGIAPVEMARASITGQTVHMQSPLVPAILLLVSLAGVSLADHHKKVLWRAVVVSLAMLVVGVLVGSIPF